MALQDSRMIIDCLVRVSYACVVMMQESQDYGLEFARMTSK